MEAQLSINFLGDLRMSTKNKVALITGACGGIGSTVAAALAEDGFDLALFDREPQALQALVDRLATFRIKTSVHVVDVVDLKQVETAVAETLRIHAQVDLLFNNAGIYYPGTVEGDPKQFIQLLQVNLIGVYNCLHALTPHMKARKSGYIFNVASQAGKVGFEGYGAYSASKFGVVGLSESLFRELSETGVKVTALCPSWVNTPMAFSGQTPIVGSDEMIAPSDIVATIRWLLSLRAQVAVREVLLECRGAVH